MTRLKERIKGLIGATGPIPVSEYMALCLFDPDAGYYTTREPFGAAGDFITAPEISQMFGELVAVWLYRAWQGAGRPLPATFAEIGPGRGTLMKDMLRTWSRLDPALAGKVSFALIETSPRLVEIQRETLAGQDAKLDWYQTVDTLPRQSLFIVGNELFDAVPIRQFVHVGESWRERMVGLDGADELHFFAGAGSVDPALLPAAAADAPQGAIVEIAPGRSALMAAIAERIAGQGGAGLFIDYGHLQPGIGDTFQALRRHQREDVLANPGEADLTAHVDFAPLADMARAHGLDAQLSTQGEFLLGMGLLERAGTLGADADPKTRQAISDAVERLAGPDAMGELFKVMKILPATRAA
ncbi:class I SAM-dependent methyltransferase [Mesorhizobium sp. B3-1-3]|uniref:class I SAM-dependent methyltransferase n=1 Tax=unclassified Mesorhizobium TaxID=325217 RepID=UPI00112838BF|nr:MULTISPECIES: class I SAM-dependent methyltransferase [unclassified Mesorhizobium]TPI66192.1 class I SAM-dependent methyltransferase [Mesorhizobium sp. B3-1-8]TPI73269.1 class I SAM-dependent methyltransferase [Mesorhizobium sp. B3-1-3]